VTILPVDNTNGIIQTVFSCLCFQVCTILQFLGDVAVKVVTVGIVASTDCASWMFLSSTTVSGLNEQFDQLLWTVISTFCNWSCLTRIGFHIYDTVMVVPSIVQISQPALYLLLLLP
jgi:hypothetical protein